MSIKNYISKTFFLFSISKIESFFKLIVNSKRYSRNFKKAALNLNNFETKDYNLLLKNKELNISMRTFQGDIDIFYEIFWKKSYNINENLLTQPNTIVDLGAHVGFTSIYYALCYPKAKIFSVEASTKNYDLLKKNTFNFKNIKTFNKAIYSKDGFINFNEEDNLSYNKKIDNNGTLKESMTMQTLIKQNDIKKIDLLKIDIEGAEAEILSNNNDWLNLVNNIIIEVHGSYNSESLVKDLHPFGFKIHFPNQDNKLKNIFLSKNSF